MLCGMAKCIIAMIKLKNSEEIRQEILQEIQNKTEERLNITVREENSDMETYIRNYTSKKIS